ncbi:MAG: S8 family peptidase [Bdellovibrionota bacterium]
MSLPALAHAERFIVKNPKGAIMGKTVQTMQFGSDTFVVVEAPKYANLLTSFANGAEHVSEDYTVAIPAGENARPGDGKAWHVDALKYAQLPQLRDGRDVTVAVLDTGVDYNHPALKDHIWSNPKGCAAPANPAGDCHGYDFDGKKPDPMDGDQHGTHCAGIIGASPDTNTNAQGVAPGVKIMAVRIIGDEQTGFLSNAALGIKYAVDNGAKVLSNSWRVYRSWSTFDPNDANIALLHDAIKYAGDHGVIFVAAAGNESIDMDTGLSADPMFPGGFEDLPNMVVVAASDQGGQMASFSNYGSGHVEVAAPGDNIISTVPGGGWMSMSGTSMATPLIVGSIARGLSAGLSMKDAISKLETTSGQDAGWNGKVKSGGVIDLTKYLAP